MFAALAKEVVPVAHDVLYWEQDSREPDFFSETTYFGRLVKPRQIDLLVAKRF